MSTPTPPGRDRAADLERLADLFFANIGQTEEYGIGLDGKRPFGFSGWHSIAAAILEAIGDEALDEDGYTTDQKDYASELYGELPAYLRREWAARKGAADHAD